MGLLIDGKWQNQWYDTAGSGGRFVRSDTQFRHWITADGSPGASGDGGFRAEAGRYHLYVSLACPWANRTMILRALKGLEDKISVSVVNPYMGDKGWTFEPDAGVVSDPVGNAQYLYEVYLKAQPDYSGRVTVPVLWDLERNTIVNNESAEIIRMLNSAFDDIGATPVDFSPAALLPQIDQVNSRIYNSINNGVYKAGFATDQAVYEKEVSSLFAALDELETELGQRRYLLGQTVTEADWRLFTTLIRFDAVYHGHFKCNLRRLVDYENLWSYTRELYQWPGVAATIDFDHIKRHYYQSHQTINPNGIVPLGPILDLERPPSRKL